MVGSLFIPACASVDASAPDAAGGTVSSDSGPAEVDGSFADSSADSPSADSTVDSRELDASTAADVDWHYPLDGGAIQCDAGYDPGIHPCALWMPLSGAISTAWFETPAAGGCGNGGAGGTGTSEDILAIGWNMASAQFPKGTETAVTFHFSSPIPHGALVTIPVSYLSITRGPNDAGPSTEQWQTPLNACSVTLTENACAPGLYGGTWIFSGTGTCTQAAQPLAGTQGGAITIGDFSFTVY
jgi:hypothetical protein